jgi:hypothetical protein
MTYRAAARLTPAATYLDRLEAFCYVSPLRHEPAAPFFPTQECDGEATATIQTG